MRAIVIEDFATGPVLAHLPEPEPAAGEVVVRVLASSVNGFDAVAAGGMLKDMMEHRFPVVLGKDFAGVVAAVGSQASRFAVGDAVFGVVMKPFLGDGAFGELVAVPESYAITALPAALTPEVAGALGLAGTAALDTVEAAKPGPGQVVLVSGATGGVGALALQYAVAAGARVIATAKPGAEAEFVTGLGAHSTVDYTGDVAAQVRALAPEGVDAVLHLAGDPAQLLALLATGGRFVSTRGVGPDQHPAAVAVMADPAAATLDRLATDVVAGTIRVPVEATYPLADIPAALDHMRAGTLGKLAVSIP